MSKLKTEINSRAMGERVLAAFEAWYKPESDACFDSTYEHGHWWITRPTTGAQWSVVDATGGDSVDGFDFELVTEGDEE